MDRFEYIKCFWRYTDDETPVLLFHEVDVENERSAVRAVEIFPDRSVRRVTGEGIDSAAGYPVPTVDEINHDTQFCAMIISGDEFENVYHSKSYQRSISFPESY